MQFPLVPLLNFLVELDLVFYHERSMYFFWFFAIIGIAIIMVKSLCYLVSKTDLDKQELRSAVRLGYGFLAFSLVFPVFGFYSILIFGLGLGIGICYLAIKSVFILFGKG